MLAGLKRWAKAIRRDAVVLWLAARDRRTPMVVRLLAVVVAAYALSPIDLIPDFIPILGYLDEAILLPLAMLLVVRLMSPALLADLRRQADAMATRPVSRWAAGVVLTLWGIAAVATAMLVGEWAL